MMMMMMMIAMMMMMMMTMTFIYQSYEELMSLAEKGSNAHVDTMRAGAITKSEDSKEEDDAYSAFRDRKSLPEPRPIFMFGQGVTTNPGNRSLPEPKQLSLHMHATRE